MRWPTKVVVLLGIGFLTSAPLLYAQNDNLSALQAKTVSQAATEEEVVQLRQEVAELRATVQQLVRANHDGAFGEARIVQANIVVDSAQPDSAALPAEAASSDIGALRKES